MLVLHYRNCGPHQRHQQTLLVSHKNRTVPAPCYSDLETRCSLTWNNFMVGFGAFLIGNQGESFGLKKQNSPAITFESSCVGFLWVSQLPVSFTAFSSSSFCVASSGAVMCLSGDDLSATDDSAWDESRFLTSLRSHLKHIIHNSEFFTPLGVVVFNIKAL